MEQSAEEAAEHTDRQEEAGRQATQRVPPACAGAGLGDGPPPGTTQWTCG